MTDYRELTEKEIDDYVVGGRNIAKVIGTGNQDSAIKRLKAAGVALEQVKTMVGHSPIPFSWAARKADLEVFLHPAPAPVPVVEAATNGHSPAPAPVEPGQVILPDVLLEKLSTQLNILNTLTSQHNNLLSIWKKSVEDNTRALRTAVAAMQQLTSKL